MKYSESHEWIDVKNSIGTVGVTHYAQKELGDIVYVELPKVGKIVQKGQEASVLESTKAAADVYTPVSGEIMEVNSHLATHPELVNTSAEKEGWLFKIKLSQPAELSELMDRETYNTKVS